MKTPQIPLPLGFAHAAPQGFVIGACNLVAAETVLGWPNWAGPIVYLYGPPASGKSHLAALWAERSGARAVEAQSLASDWAELLPETGRIVVEELDALASEEALFHLANAVVERSGALLLTARAAPGALALRLRDLKTRLLSATAVEIGDPDEEFLEEFLLRLAEQRQMAMDPAVAAYCVSRMERTQLAGVNLISALDQRSLSLKGRLSQKLACEVIDALSQQPPE